jgi:hypothetical protein
VVRSGVAAARRLLKAASPRATIEVSLCITGDGYDPEGFSAGVVVSARALQGGGDDR